MLPLPAALRPSADRLFGDRFATAQRFADLLADHGPERGLIGPREVERLWERHILNSALLADAIEEPTTVADVGSGAGLPGVALAIARPDLEVTLIETMQRRVTWLEEIDVELDLGMEVVRARAEDLHGSRSFGVVTARAVASLDKLARWALPLVAAGGTMLAVKGASAQDELDRAAGVLSRLGSAASRIERYGVGEVEVPTTVVQVRRGAQATRKGDPRG